MPRRRITVLIMLACCWAPTSCDRGPAPADEGGSRHEGGRAPPPGGDEARGTDAAVAPAELARDPAVDAAADSGEDAGAAPPPIAARARELAARRWGGRRAGEGSVAAGRLRSLDELRAPELEPFLLGDHAYRATVHNPGASIAGRPTFSHALITGETETHYLESDEDVRRFLTSRWVSVADAKGATRALRAFVALRSYELRTEPPLARHPGPVPVAERGWRLTVKRVPDGWIVTSGVLWDPFIQAVSQYRLEVGQRSGIRSVRRQRLLMQQGGYR